MDVLGPRNERATTRQACCCATTQLCRRPERGKTLRGGVGRAGDYCESVMGGMGGWGRWRGMLARGCEWTAAVLLLCVWVYGL